MTFITTLCEQLTRLVLWLLGLLVGAIVVITLAGVWTRYVMNDPLSWTEQISRILFVWLTFLGAAVLYRHKMHITIDMFIAMLPARPRMIVTWTVEASVALFLVILLIYSTKLSYDTWGNTFGALDITPASFYLAAPVASLLMLLYFVEKIIDPTKRQPAGATSID
jgi:TRAP-type C4-dicarboxylate transport system permease small subunit